MDDKAQAYVEAGRTMGLWPRGGRLLYYLRRQLFRGTDLRGKSVLDVGCSNGRYSAWAAVSGAERVVGLEPMGDGSGSSGDSRRYFEGFAQRLGLSNMEILDATLQDYECPDDSYDVVLLHAVINHLDEDACIRLRESAEARRSYEEIFRGVHRLMRDGGSLIITDAPTKTLYSDLGRERSPFNRRIDFKKHQQPETWAEVIAPAGFELHEIRWLPWAKYRQLMAPLSNRLAAYVLAFGFRLEMICRK